jgi:hypothetical protein
MHASFTGSVDWFEAESLGLDLGGLIQDRITCLELLSIDAQLC